MIVRLPLLLTFPILASSALAGSKAPAPVSAETAPGGSTGLSDIFTPHLHLNAAYGGTTSDAGHENAAGHHDPVTDGWTIQGLEAGLSARMGEYFDAFGVVHVFQDAETRDWDHEEEEYFLKIKNLPAGLELRGGKYLNRYGLHNAVHMHAWDFTDNNLVHGRFLGDHGLVTLGGELSWKVEPAAQWTSVLSLSAGEAQQEEHEHEHEHEEEGGEPLYEAEGALFNSTVFTADWTNVYHFNDFHQYRFGLSGAVGDNEWDRRTVVYGVHAEYQWRENGLEPGGSYFRWRTEAMLRDVDALSGHHEEEEHEHEEEEEGHQEEHEHGEESRPGSFSEAGLASSVVYGMPSGFAGPLELALRGEWVEGVADAGLAERFRISPAVRLYLNEARNAYLAAQYNHDEYSPGGSEDSVWLSFGLNWGGPEVR